MLRLFPYWTRRKEKVILERQPTVQEMDRMKDGQFLLWRRREDERPWVCIRGSEIQENIVSFVCPFCWKNTLKNGRGYSKKVYPTINSKRIKHSYEWNGRESGNKETIGVYCHDLFLKEYTGFCFFVTPNTATKKKKIKN